MSNTTPAAASPLAILDIHDEVHGLVHLTLAEPPGFRIAYRTPGQYVQIFLDGHRPGFFAIGAGPGRSPLELLVKRGTPICDAIAEMKRGDCLRVSPPMGPGFPMQRARGNDLFLVGVGSGVAPLRAAVHAVLDDRSSYGRVVWVYGVRNDCHFPYEAEMDGWAARGIEVVKVCSRPESKDWRGPVGYVQDALLTMRPKLAPTTAVFVCGMRHMVDSVKAAFHTLGLPDDRVFLNF